MQQICANERLWLKRIYFLYIYMTSDRGPESKAWIFFPPSSSSSSTLLLEAMGNLHAHIQKRGEINSPSRWNNSQTDACFFSLSRHPSQMCTEWLHMEVKGVNVQTCQRSARLQAHKPNCPRGVGGRGASFYRGVAVLSSDISLPPIFSVSPEKRNSEAELCRCCVTVWIPIKFCSRQWHL